MKMIKIFKKPHCSIIAIAAVLAQPAFSMQSIDDVELSSIDGRAGITIETQLHDTTTIGEVAYSDGNGAGIYLSDISIDKSSVKTKIDIFDEGVLNIKISDITQGDIWVRNIALGDPKTSFGAVGITNFDYDTQGSYNVKFAPVDPNGNGVKQAGIIFDIDMASSSFDFTFVDEAEFSQVGERGLINGNTISYRTIFSDFKAEATTVYIDNNLTSDGRNWARINLGSVSGAARFEDVSFGSVASGAVQDSAVLGSAGFSDLIIDNKSFIAITGHDDNDPVEGDVDIQSSIKANLGNFYFETNGNRANFGNIAFNTDSSASNDPLKITLDTINRDFRKGLALSISNVNQMDLTIRDLFVSHYNKVADSVSDEAVFGTIGIENIDFNGGSAEFSIIGRAGSGNQGVETGFSLPDGTTLDFTINDLEDVAGNSLSDPKSPDVAKGSELRASIEINDFSAESSIDVVDLGSDQGTALKVTFKSMEGAFDIRNFSAGNRVIHKGSFGRIQVDGMNLKRGYLIVDAL